MLSFSTLDKNYNDDNLKNINKSCPIAKPSRKQEQLNINHHAYLKQPFIHCYNNNIDRSSVNSRYIINENPVQRSIQTSEYFMNNFETLNNQQVETNDINKYLIRNPVNTRRDNYEKNRNKDEQLFMSSGNLHSYVDNKPVNTRANKAEINSRYIPIPRNTAIPAEKI